MVTQFQIEYKYANGTYPPILTKCILGAFQCATITVGGNGEDVHNVILGARNDGVVVRDTIANGRNGCTCVYRKCLLGAGC